MAAGCISMAAALYTSPALAMFRSRLGHIRNDQLFQFTPARVRSIVLRLSALRRVHWLEHRQLRPAGPIRTPLETMAVLIRRLFMAAAILREQVLRGPLTLVLRRMPRRLGIRLLPRQRLRLRQAFLTRLLLLRNLLLPHRPTEMSQGMYQKTPALQPQFRHLLRLLPRERLVRELETE
jgi:hypothetical protein